ncbi:hypothetical protein A5714_24875 [Mycobacterium sp. E2462]|uniref:hypothetical protein n=1 Tax=Mycobacterium sp. E2462 TaxID=1834133 RepID=UPI0007FDE449|nr:hypothetical protein [Mycobacterium sp. E2462]OBI04996.1 hypothetical protein A5714_24875 [Mycobacterium sp. E2462]
MKAQGIEALGALFDRAAVSEALDRLEQSHREVFVRAYCLRMVSRSARPTFGTAIWVASGSTASRSS